MNITDIDDMIRQYTNAEIAVLQGKSITMNGQSMSMESLSEIRKGREYWEKRRSSLISSRAGKTGYKLARFP
ncbi:hypothetical protein [Morganella psychrotolerans]|uniref:Primosomal replication protein PriB/PriC domain protein n=1 Tax=Morganella psychrotolerans TaxID=368603 RepID=A0A1B8HFB8_9GAMM|nr:hypothetical protein [Morganella psychrotolerans]OBU07768.1 hypothetical protein AYY18_05980 [Morganella psychrotolerans]